MKTDAKKLITTAEPEKTVRDPSIKGMLPAKLLKSALFIAAGLALAPRGAFAQTVIDFSMLPSGTPISAQYASEGVNFALQNAPGAFGVPAIGGSPYLGGLSNSPTGIYPTFKYLNFNFTTPVSIESFTFNNYGNNVSIGASTYSAFSSNGTLLGSGNLGSQSVPNSPMVITLNLSNVSELQFYNGGAGGVGGNWEFVVGSVTYNIDSYTGPTIQNSAPVGIPTTADFTVMGAVATGGSADNTVNSLTFTEGSSLLIHNTLFVTQGPVVLVNGSSITLDGSLSTSQLQMLEGSSLSGVGSILGDLSNGGVVSPGDGPGTLRVTGNYTQTATGQLNIRIGGFGATQHDLLAVGGSAHLGGSLQLQQINGFHFNVAGEQITFLTATGGVTGKFAVVNNPPLLNATLVYEPNAVVLEAAQGSLVTTLKELSGVSGNLLALSGSLDSAANNPRAAKIFAILDADSMGKLVRDVQHIDPEQLTSTSSAGTASSGVHLQNLQLRMQALQSGMSGFSALGFHISDNSPDSSAGYAGPAGPDDKSSKEIAPPAPANDRWGAFITGAGEFDRVGDTQAARGFNLDSGGITMGVDYRFTDHFVAGLFSGYTYTGINIADGGRIAVDAGKVGLYATYFDGGFYVNSAVQGGYDAYETNRVGLGGTAHSSPIGGDLNLLVAPGYNWTARGFTFGPTSRFQYAYQSTNGFTETGSLAPMTVASLHSDSLISAFGMKASYDWKIGTTILRPELRLEWEHEYGDVATSVASRLADGAGNGFTVTGPEIGRDSLHIGAGFAAVLSERLSAYIYYDGEVFRTNYDSSTVTGGFRISF
jgi:uncharacterized protein with beta-barrel porin domain